MTSDDDFDNLFTGDTITKKPETEFKFSLYIGDKLLVSKISKSSEPLLGAFGEIHKHCFTIKWRIL